jgi:site-specific DNA-cytosine methylase
MTRVFTALFPFCGLGAGARGFVEATARLGRDAARFESLGGIDVDPEACEDFGRLTGSPALRADISTLTPAALLGWLGARGQRRPDAVFLSPPCKGFSRLLGTRAAATERYQRLNRLVFQGAFLVLETWSPRPPLIVVENVPGIQHRGAEVLGQLRQLLVRYGYALHEASHDCGVIGGLAQHRRRYLLVARDPRQVPGYVYQPPRRRVRGCGEVLGELPLPGGGQGGVLHELPAVAPITLVRLALIPPGGDHRHLPRAGELALPGGEGRHEAKYRVEQWDEPAHTVTGATRPGSGAPAAVADPRLTLGHEPRRGSYGVMAWGEPAPTIRGVARASNGAGAVADPRLTTPVKPGQALREVFARDRVLDWLEPAPAVTGPGSNSPSAVADVRGLALGCQPRTGAYGVLSWQQAAATVTGAARWDNGPFSVADPRVPPGWPAPPAVPVIISPWGLWHRPLTTLELAALQGLPATLAGKPLELAGRTVRGWRERIGNAVPVGAAAVIAQSLLRALLASVLGDWSIVLSPDGQPVWVRRDGHQEEDSTAEVGHG